MTTIPSMKGSLTNELAEDVRKLIAEGTVSRSEVERRLSPEDLEVLDSEITVTGWYDVRFYARCAELLRDVLGGGRNEYLFQRGLDKGKKLIEAGLYQQMEYASRAQVQDEMDPEARFKAYGRDLRLFMTLSKSLLNFTSWSASVDPDHADRYIIVVEGAAAYPDALAWATEGLIESMAASHGMGNMWRHRRVGDRIEFRMTRSL
jgi:hypothetical protein